jgi:hypothetical protein
MYFVDVIKKFNVEIFSPRLEDGSNTSTVHLRVVGGDEKGNQCPGYMWATIFLGHINTGIWLSRCGEPRSRES